MSEAKKVDYMSQISTLSKRASMPFREVFFGVQTGIMPWGKLLIGIATIQVGFAFHLEYELAIKLGLRAIYPRAQWLYIIYYYCWFFSPLVFWGVYRAMLSSRLRARLTEVFKSIGLQNRLGRLPHLILDLPVDETTRKLRLTRACLSLPEFQKHKIALESALHIYIDEMRENRKKGTVDVLYAHTSMPATFEVGNYENYHKWEFTVGRTRSKVIRVDLSQVPHLLVAGQTGGGKSTFLRHFITSLYLSDKTAQFTLIDLKGGLEFQTFGKHKRVRIAGDIGRAVAFLKEVNQMVQSRFELLRKHNCKDILELLSGKKVTGITLNREIIVVDEAAELFLTNSLASPDEVRSAKEILSRISRLGRSLGIHLVIATQRPDSRALDPQIKSNLPGVLCFQMVNDISSITVLGTGRATDLPPIPGRGIWKVSMDCFEIQTPFLAPESAAKLLASQRKDVSDTDPTSKTPAPTITSDSGLKRRD